MDKQEALKRYFGHDAFRPGQEALVDALLAGGDVLGIMPTGAGKSVCYQVPALLLTGVTLVISPLISLMKDQVAALRSAGIPAAFLNSSLTPRQLELATSRAVQGEYRVIYVAPERLEAPSFLRFARGARIALIAVDEAHCVSQWGQDFRPSYLRIRDFVDSLPQRPPLGAFTATATSRVRTDIVRLLGLRHPLEITTGFDRPNLFFEVLTPASRDRALLEILSRQEGRCGIVYCATRKNVEAVALLLQENGFEAARYHAGLSDEERRQSQEDFQYDRVQVMVATNAFGMGIDKSNVRFVVHYNMPLSMEAYYQEAGRAGRDGAPAECVLLFSRQDIVTGRWLIEHGEPNDSLTAAEQQEKRRQDIVRLNRMADYCTQTGCLRRRLLEYFGERAPLTCGACSACSPGRYLFAAAQDRQTSARRRARGGPVSDSLFERLRVCRMRQAGSAHLPPYLVCDDSTLMEMARLRPLTRQALLRVRGIGEIKADRYGPAFLEVIRQWTAEHPG